MKTAFKKNEDLLRSVEWHLQSSLHPVDPNPEFISKLRTRLVTPDPPMLETGSGAMSLLIIAFGLLTGVTILLLGKKAIVLAVAGIGLWISRRKAGNKPIEI